MTLLRALRSILFGETWTLPLGVGAIILLGWVVRTLDAALWRDAGGALLVVGVLLTLAAAAPRTARRGPGRGILLVAVVFGVATVAVFAWSRYGPRTAPPASPVANLAFTSAADPEAPAHLWAVGDGAIDTTTARVVARRIAADGPSRVLYLGDVYERGTADDFRKNYAPSFGRLAGITAPTPGNHDWPRHRDGYDAYWRRALKRPETAAWYRFQAGGWTIISIASETQREAGSDQLAWLQHELRAPGTCRLAFWHRPRFSAATRHGDEDKMAPAWDALRGRATIVVAGHDHTMQRLRPIDGITSFVSGSGGRSRYAVRADPRLAFADARHEGALRLRLRRGSASYAFVTSGGRVLDRGTVRCRPVSR